MNIVSKLPRFLPWLFVITVLARHAVALADTPSYAPPLNQSSVSARAEGEHTNVIGHPATLCKPEEVIIFSCMLPKAEMISLCASKDASNDAGYMQYRFGRNAASIELEYPKAKTPAKNNYKYYYFAFPKGGTAAITFRIGSYRYSLYSTSSAFGYNGAGVIVNRGQEAIRVSFQKCIGEPIMPNEMQSPIPFFGLQRLDLPDAGEDISFDGPEPGPEPGTTSYHPQIGEPEDWRRKGKR